MTPRCQTCYSLRDGHDPRLSQFVPGSGPNGHCQYMLWGEGPGEEENNRLIPFYGKSGQEQRQTYCRLARIDPDECWIDNTVHCRPPSDKTPTDKEAVCCSQMHMPDVLARVQPDIIFALGGVASRLFGAEVEIEHGYPRPGSIYSWNGIVVPMFHPALGMHDTSRMIPLLQDWERIGRWLDGEWEPPTDQYPQTDYQLVDARGVGKYCGEYGGRVMEVRPELAYCAVDTERHGQSWKGAYSVQFSLWPGTGRMIMHHDTRALRELWEFIGDCGFTVGLHNAPQDMDWLERCFGMPQSWQFEVLYGRPKIVDTMQWAYQIGDLPQGLKALGYRLFGVRMESYVDVVRPPSVEKLAEWVVEARELSSRQWTTVEELEQKTLKCGVCGKGTRTKAAGDHCVSKGCEGRYAHVIKTRVRPSLQEKDFERILTNMLKSDPRTMTYKPWKQVGDLEAKWVGKQQGARWAEILERIGEPPIEGIAHVPLEKQVEYGCRDADITLRFILYYLERLEREHQDPHDTDSDGEQERERGKLWVNPMDVDNVGMGRGTKTSTIY